MKQNVKITIIDYEMSNMFSVKHACDFVGIDAEISSDKNKLLSADAAILPGVGAFPDAMNNLERLDLIAPIKDFIASGRQFLGICLGLQLLFTESVEFGISRGLDVIPGHVKKFPDYLKDVKIKVPHVSWNQIFKPENNKTQWDDTPLCNISNGEYMYFVHSFYIVPEREDDILTKTDYEGIEFCSGILRDNVFGTQFHPEKSGKEGLKIYKYWKEIIDKINEE